MIFLQVMGPVLLIRAAAFIVAKFYYLLNKSTLSRESPCKPFEEVCFIFFPAEELSSIHRSGRRAPGEANSCQYLIRKSLTRRLWHIYSGSSSPGVLPYLNIGRGSVLSISKIVMRVEVLLYILFIFPCIVLSLVGAPRTCRTTLRKA